MTAQRTEVTGLDDRFCQRCGDITDVDAAGLCQGCAETVERPPMTLTHHLTEEFLAFSHDGESWLVANGPYRAMAVIGDIADVLSSDAVLGNIADALVKNTKPGCYMVTLSIELERIDNRREHEKEEESL